MSVDRINRHKNTQDEYNDLLERAELQMIFFLISGPTQQGFSSNNTWEYIVIVINYHSNNRSISMGSTVHFSDMVTSWNYFLYKFRLDCYLLYLRTFRFPAS